MDFQNKGVSQALLLLRMSQAMRSVITGFMFVLRQPLWDFAEAEAEEEGDRDSSSTPSREIRDRRVQLSLEDLPRLPANWVGPYQLPAQEAPPRDKRGHKEEQNSSNLIPIFRYDDDGSILCYIACKSIWGWLFRNRKAREH